MTKGIRITQTGIGVDKAADYQKTMDERWPVVEMAFMGIVNGTYSDTTFGTKKNAAGTIYHIPIYHHGLGYVPGFRLIQISATINNFGNSLAFDVFADEQDIYAVIFPSPANSPVAFNFNYFLAVYNRDLTKTFSAPVDIVVPADTSGPSEYGIKIAHGSQAAAMNVDDKSQYSLNSNAKSLAYQAHGIQPAETSGTYNGSLIVQHFLGYPPTYFIAQMTVQSGIANPSLGKLTSRRFFPGYGIAFADSIQLRVRGAQAALSGNFIYLILKEPVEFSG